MTSMDNELRGQMPNPLLTNKFSEIYSTGGKLWKGVESASGRGSDTATTARVREMLPRIVHGLGVNTLLDAGCGDWNWMRQIDLGNVEYHGVDIVPGIIDANRQKYPHHDWGVADITSDTLFKADLILCRSVLFHLSLDNVHKAVANLKSTGSPWLLTTTYPLHAKDWDEIKDGGFHPVNFERSPFNWPKPYLLIPETNELEGWLGLFKLSEIS